MGIIEKIQQEQFRELPTFRSGDTLKVSVRIKEGEKERIQVFQGVVIKVGGTGIGKSFTVRKISDGIGVERVFPIHCPDVEKVEIVRTGRVRRRARPYYLRGLRGKKARLRERTRELLARKRKFATSNCTKARIQHRLAPRLLRFIGRHVEESP